MLGVFAYAATGIFKYFVMSDINVDDFVVVDSDVTDYEIETILERTKNKLRSKYL